MVLFIINSKSIIDPHSNIFLYVGTKTYIDTGQTTFLNSNPKECVCLRI